MHFQNPSLNNHDGGEVKMCSAPEIISSRNRNELCLETGDNYHKVIENLFSFPRY